MLPSVSALCLASAAVSGVQNFRAVSPSLPRVYRSAALDHITHSGLDELRSRQVRTVIDLRNSDEVARARAKASSGGEALWQAFEEEEIQRVHVPILRDVDAFFDEVERRLPPTRAAEAFLWRCVDGQRLTRLLYDEVSRGGNALLNTAMLAIASHAWATAMRELGAGLSSGAVLFHCAHGKDRTGVLAALVQHAANDDQRSIVRAYAKSEKLLDGAPLPRGGGDTGVDWTALRGSPPHAMVETLEWLEREHGGVDDYLHSLGCDERWRDALLLAGGAALEYSQCADAADAVLRGSSPRPSARAVSVLSQGAEARWQPSVSAGPMPLRS